MKKLIFLIILLIFCLTFAVSGECDNKGIDTDKCVSCSTLAGTTWSPTTGKKWIEANSNYKIYTAGYYNCDDFSSCNGKQYSTRVCNFSECLSGSKNACGTCGTLPTEVCDGKDNDCDGSTDEGVKNIYYLDADGDGYGNPNSTIQACSVPINYVNNSTDCDDGNNLINPNAIEVCDGIDNNCDGLIDVGLKNVCGMCGETPVEVCDGEDNDCDGLIDEDGVCGCYNPVDPIKSAVYSANKINLPLELDWNAYYPFDGNTVDAAGKLSDGIITNAVLTSDRFLNINKAYNFDGSGDYITITPNSTIKDNFTVSVWAKTNSATGSHSIFSTRSGGDFTFDIQFDGISKLHGDLGTGSGWISTSLDAGYAFSLAKWYNITYVVSKEKTEIYINGILINTIKYASSSPLLWNVNKPVTLGYSGVPGGEQWFNGSIDDVLIISSSLTAGEVLQLYKKTNKNGFNFNNIKVLQNLPVSYWPFDVNAGDYVGKNNGAISGATKVSGKFNDAYSFDGVNDYISIPATNVSLNPDGKKTISFWFKPDPLSRGNVISKYRSDTADAGYLFQINDGYFAGRIKSNSWKASTQGPVWSIYYGFSDLNEWIHGALVWDTTTNPKYLKLYINGNLIDTNISLNGDFVNDGAPFYFGASHYGPTNTACDMYQQNYPGCFYKGLIDDVSFFDKVLSDCEIKQLALGPSACLPVCVENVCDGEDDNNNGLVDEGLTSVFYRDVDGDGFGGVSDFVEACVAPEGYVNNNDDCDDLNSFVNPSVIEVCDTIDNDCDGAINEDLDCDSFCSTCDFVEDLINVVPLKSSVVDGSVVLDLGFSCESNLLLDEGKINIDSIFVDTKSGSKEVLFEPVLDCNSQVVLRQVVINNCENTNYVISFGFGENDSFCDDVNGCRGIEKVFLASSCENNSFYWNGKEIKENNKQTVSSIPDNSIISVIVLLFVVLFLIKPRTKN